MMSDINDFIDTDEKEEKAEKTAEELPEEKPIPEETETEDGELLTSFQKTELNNLATSYKVDVTYVEKHFWETWETPIFQTVKDIGRKFRMVKRDVENHLEDLAELVHTTFFVFGKYTSYIPGDWNNVISSLVGLLTDPDGGPPQLMNITSWEDPGSKIYKNLADAVPLHSFKIYLDCKKDKSTKKKQWGLSSNTTFKHGVSPIDSDPAKYGKMSALGLLAHFGDINVHDSVGASGLSKIGGNNRSDPRDLKAVRVLCTTYQRRMKAKDSDFPNMFLMQSNGTDFEGGKIIVKFPPFAEYEILKQTLAEKGGFKGVAIGPISEYEGKTYIDVYYWIPIDE